MAPTVNSRGELVHTYGVIQLKSIYRWENVKMVNAFMERQMLTLDMHIGSSTTQTRRGLAQA
jgi:hypothetical protein